MATLTIRNVPDHIKHALRLKAAEKGRSLEETLRQMLSDEVRPSAPASHIDAEEIMRRAASLGSDPPHDRRYLHFTQKELSDALCGEYDDL